MEPGCTGSILLLLSPCSPAPSLSQPVGASRFLQLGLQVPQLIMKTLIAVTGTGMALAKNAPKGYTRRGAYSLILTVSKALAYSQEPGNIRAL